MEAVMKLVRNPWVIRLCRIAIGVIFAAAGLAKIGDMEAFAQSIHNFRVVPVVFENVLAMTLPWIEVIIALALILGIRARAGAYSATALLVVFTLAIVAAVLRDLDIACGCFGTDDAARTGWIKVLENVGMIVVGAVACLQPRR